jgi:hypothetical protein
MGISSDTDSPRRASRHASHLGLRVLGGMVGLAALLGSIDAAAQTWQGGRDSPSLSEIVAVDATGEQDWPFGREDVVGDGLDRFEQPEQNIDIRSLYAATSTQQLWVRLYVSDANAPGDNVTAFVFIDADQDADTGGTAVSAELDARFTSDSSPGGYDYVAAVDGNATVVDVWEWSEQDGSYASMPAAANQAEAEVGTAQDPLRLDGASHGYLQLLIDLEAVGLTPACDAQLYARTVNDTGALGDGDLEVGQVGPCVPGDGDADRIPDLVVPSRGCDADADCPGGGVCVDGECVLAPPCVEDADCDADEICMDGMCVARGGGSCDSNADCAPLVCVGNECVPCFTSGASCPSGTVCAPDGRCVSGQDGTSGGPLGAAGADGIYLEPGEEIQGGAGSCVVGRGWSSSVVGFWLLVLTALGLWRRARI